jgi:hypothetical protein
MRTAYSGSGGAGAGLARSYRAEPRAAPAPDREDTLQLVRDNVRKMLSRAPSFRALPPEKQRQVAHDTVKVARFIADAGGETAGLPMTAIISNPAAALAAPARPFAPPAAPQAPDGSQQRFDTAGAAWQGAATGGAASLMEGMVDAVDFPGFVAGLIEGVFTAIVKTSIQQMEAYATMVANVAKSVDQYMADNVSTEQAMDQLVNAQPDLFEADMGGETPQVAQRSDANPDQMGGFLQSLGLPFDLDTTDPEVIKTEVVPAQRMVMAMDRQKLLATMVLMGINRVVVIDGKIQASVVFDLNARDIVRRNQERATSFDQNYRQTHNKTRKNGWWIFSTERETESSLLNVKTNVTTSQTDESDSSLQLKTKLTGNVDLRFKSDYFPLEKMLDMLGTNQTVLTQVAQQPTPQQAQQVQAIAPPPAPALPPPPAFAGGGAPAQ